MQNEAKQLGHEAAQIASDHADRIEYNWSADAYNLFCDYAKTHDTFTTEQVRLSFPTFHKPPTNRAWGGVALKAQKNGIIKAVGIVPTKNRTAHGANATLWKSQILDVVIKCKMEFEVVYK